MLKSFLSLFGASDSTESDHHNGFDDAGVFDSASAIQTGPLVNVDGTPMLDGCMMDVTGKPYGDSGHTFEHDFGTDTHDSFGSASVSIDFSLSDSFGSDC